MNGNGPHGYADACKHCGLRVRDEDPEFYNGGKPDPCLGVLPGVIQACCGHGKRVWGVNGPYVVLADAPPGTAVYQAKEKGLIRASLGGEDAIRYFTSQGVGPDVVT